jgi:hypothetical protein
MQVLAYGLVAKYMAVLTTEELSGVSSVQSIGAAPSSMPTPARRGGGVLNSQQLNRSTTIPRQAIDDAIPENVKSLRDAEWSEVFDTYMSEDERDAYEGQLALPRLQRDEDDNLTFVRLPYEIDENFNPHGAIVKNKTGISAKRETQGDVQERLRRYYRKKAEIKLMHDAAVDTSYGLGPERAGMEDKVESLIPRPRTKEEQAKFDALQKLDATAGAPTEREKQYGFMLSRNWSERLSVGTREFVDELRDPSSNIRTNADGSQRSLDDTYAVLIDSMKKDALQNAETTASLWSPEVAEFLGMPEIAEGGKSVSTMPYILEKLGPEKGIEFLSAMSSIQKAGGGIADYIYEGMISLDELTGGVEKIGVDIPGVGEFYPFKNLGLPENARRAVGFIIDAMEVLDFTSMAATPAFAALAAIKPVKQAATAVREVATRRKLELGKFNEVADETSAQARVRTQQIQEKGVGSPTIFGLPVFDEAIDAGRTAVLVKIEKGRIKKERETRAKFEADPDLADSRRAKIEASRIYVSLMRGATQERMAAKAALAKEVADKNLDIREQLLKEFEVLTGKEVTRETTIMPETEFVDGKQVAKGTPKRVRVYDPKKARQAGLELTDEVHRLETMREGDVEVTNADIARLATGQDAMTHPILNPDKLDAVVAVASDFKKAYPEKWNDKETVIDNLFRLTAQEDLTGEGSPALMNILGSYGLSFEDYILTVLGSGSQAGKILQKFAQIKRATGKTDQQKSNERELQMANAAHSNFIRTINVTRAALVSMVRTAMRNLETGAIRSPFEAQANAIDNVLWRTQDEGFSAGGKEFVSWNNWRDSLRHFKYMYDDPESATEITDFILKNPQMMDQWNAMFNNINEIQQASGRGRGGFADTILSELEDAVLNMNAMNRWQEFIVRRGIFLGDMERLIRREWKVDYLDELNDGKLYDFINNNPDIKPDGARSYEEIVAESVEHALKYTFASDPDNFMLRSLSSLMSRTGFTAVEHFPRFLFNQMELVGRYIGGGTGLVALRQIGRGIQKVQGKEVMKPLSAKDRRRLGDNLGGAMMIAAAYQYITAEDEEGNSISPGDYKKVKLNDQSVINVTPQSPMRQILWIARFLKELRDNSDSGNLSELAKYSYDEESFTPYTAGKLEKDNESAFFNSRAWSGAMKWFTMPTQIKDFTDTFLMSRTGIPSDIVSGVTDTLLLPTNVNDEDLAGNEKLQRNIGKILGNWVRKNLTFFLQFTDLERGLGRRTSEKKDFSIDPIFGASTKTFLDNFKRPLRTGGAVDAEEEAQMRRRERLYQDPDVVQTRRSPFGTFFLGISADDPDSEDADFLTELGFGEYWGDLGSRDPVGSIRNWETRLLRETLPLLRAQVEASQDDYSQEYQKSQDQYPDMTEATYVKERSRSLVRSLSRLIKERFNATIGEKGILADDPPYVKYQREFRRLPKTLQKDAAKDFKNNIGRNYDATNVEDLLTLVKFAKKREEVYRKAIRKR